MRQWMLRITAFAERLINELDGLDWPDSIKLLQRNWIGRSEGAHVTFILENFENRPTSLVAMALDTDKAAHPTEDAVPEGHRVHQTAELTVFTTRPDTLFGATYMVLSPEHPLVDVFADADHEEAIATCRAEIAGKSDLERTELSKEKNGVFTGAYAVNPVNGERIPVWIADYVLMGYGTGAIMAVPAHDERDWEFAKKYNLPIRKVVEVPGADHAADGCLPGYGTAIHSHNVALSLDGLPTDQAKAKIVDWLETNGSGQRKINYKLRDWLFSRQRYWGEPFPVIWQDGKTFTPSPRANCPCVPPDLDDFKPTGTGEPPLARATDWVRYSDAATRETNTMPQWAGSCWYYLRYCDPGTTTGVSSARNPNVTGWAAASQAASICTSAAPNTPSCICCIRASGTRCSFDRGYVSTPEPFQRLVNQGLILAEDGRKMSKRWGNVIDPSRRDRRLRRGRPAALRDVHGSARTDQTLEHDRRAGCGAVPGARVASGHGGGSGGKLAPERRRARRSADTSAQNKVVHATIKKVTADIDALSFNTAIAQMMVCTNEFTGATERPVAGLRTLLQVLNPFAPHLTEELNETLETKFPTGGGLLAARDWPEYDEALLVEDEIEMPVQINGKLRDRISVKKDAAVAQIESAALAAPKVLEHLEGRSPKKVIVVPGKLVNIVT